MTEAIKAIFPRLRGTDYRVSSPRADAYNCIAWAAGVTSAWWWPGDPERTYWPEGVPRVPTLEGFCAAFATLGYVPCESESHEAGFEKIALYAAEGAPRHAARQLPGGRWTSKLGRAEDIEHGLRDLEGAVYGSVAQVMKRPRPAATEKS